MSNTFNTLEQIGDELMIDFENNLNIVKTSNIKYQQNFTKEVNGWKSGSTVKVGLPLKYLVHSGPTIATFDDVTERTIDLTINQDYNTNCQIGLRERTLDSHDYGYYMRPMAENLANHVENWFGTLIGQSLHHVVGTAGSAISSLQTLGNARARAAKLGIPASMLCLDEANYATLINSANLKNNNDVAMSKDINRRYFSGNFYNFDVYHSIFAYQHTAGVGDGSSTPANGVVAAGAIDGAVTSGSTIHIDGLTDATTPFKKGDKIYLVGTHSYNQKGAMSTGVNMELTVTADVTLSGATEADVSVSPAIVTDAASPYKNVAESSVADGVVVMLHTANTGAGSTDARPYSISFAYDPRALLFAAPPLENPQMPKNQFSRAFDPDTKTSILLQSDYTIGTRANQTRADIIYGGYIYAPMVVGILGS